MVFDAHDRAFAFFKCQSACNFDPGSASKIDPLLR